jgi:hypothetical protein
MGDRKILSGVALLLFFFLAPAFCAGEGEESGSPASGGEWTARVLWESDAPVWSVLLADVLENRAGLEIVAMDDKGRGTLLFTGNNEAIPWLLLMDGRWLGTAVFGEADPSRPGRELYLAGERGNLYQVTVLPQGGFESRLIWFARDEIHTLVLDEVVPGHEGLDLIVCTLRGGMHLLTPGDVEDEFVPDGAWESRLIHMDPGRIRNVLVHDFDPTLAGKEMLTVSRSGRFSRLGWRCGKLEELLIFQDTQGLARLALGKPDRGQPPVYTAGDDGRIFRYERITGGVWQGRVIHKCGGPARGVAAGRFTEEKNVECVAVFGYSREVTLLVRHAGEEEFEAQTIYTDGDKGHWLAAVDFDGRGLDEIIVCGYSGRVTLLTREESAAGSRDAAKRDAAK